MSKKVPFTEEQLRVLELNPYTYSVSSNRITFTLEFKKFFRGHMYPFGIFPVTVFIFPY